MQLILAFAALCHNATYALTMPEPIHPRFVREYPQITSVPRLSLDDVRAGDVVVVPDVTYCNGKLAKRGVHWYIWILSSRARRYNWRSLQNGCRLLSHNHWLAHDTLAGVSLQPHWILHPYISPSITRRCGGWRSAESKQRLVLLDSDTPDRIETAVEESCARAGCSSLRVTNRTRAQMLELLSSAMVVVDWTMIGSERMPIEGVLCGAVLVTGATHCGQDMEDFPIPRRNVLTHPRNLSAAIPRILANFAREQRGYSFMRQKYRALGSHSLRREAAAFLAAHAASASTRKYKRFYAPATDTGVVLAQAVAVAKAEGMYPE